MNYPGMPKRRGVWPLVVGIVFMVVISPVIFFGAMIVGAKDAIDVVEKAPVISQGGSVQVGADQYMVVLADVGPAADDGINASSGGPVPTCTVRDPQGQDVQLDNAESSLTVSKDGRSYAFAGTFKSTDQGRYTIDCEDGNALVPAGPEAEESLTNFVTYVLVGLVAATIVGIIGLILVIVGIVKLVKSNKERTQFRMGGYGQQQWGHPGGGYHPYQ